MSYKKLKLLIIGHSETDVSQLCDDFVRNGKQLIYKHVNSLADVRSALDTSSWDAIIAEYSMTGFDAIQVLDLLKADNRMTPFIVYTSRTDEQTVLSVMRNRANDCVLKGHSLHLMLVIDRELECMDLKRRKRQADSHIYRMTYHDELTGLPKRNLFCEKVTSLLSDSSGKEGLIAAVYFIKVDRLSRINSRYGYDTSDILIQQFANRLSVYSGRNCILTRIGGGKFAFFHTGLSSTQQVQAFANQILKLVTAPFTINRLEFYVTLNMGICVYPHDGREIEVLLANAENALSFTKKTWRNTCRFYAREIGDASLQKIKIGQSLRRVVEDEELVLHYQPVIDLGTGKIIGTEALVRWNHPEFGLLSPDKFVSLAGETGSIVEIGKWVLYEACRQAGSWQQETGREPFFVAVNISAIELDQFQLISHVAEALHATGLDPARLELEIAESVLMQDVEGSIRILKELKQMGVRIVMDNFGAGYSSLSYLRRLPIDTVKIDRSLIRDIANDSDSSVVVTAIIMLARNLGLTIRAEGVESQAQLDLLEKAECHHAQGFLFSHPAAAENFSFLTEQCKTGTFS